jgi:hypothetical protein
LGGQTNTFCIEAIGRVAILSRAFEEIDPSLKLRPIAGRNLDLQVKSNDLRARILTYP